MRAVAAGEEAAFTLLFRRYQPAVFRFACRMTGSPEAAEDLTQECFVRVLRSASRFDPARGSLRVYLYATARNLAVTRYQKTGPAGSEDDADLEIGGGGLGPGQLVVDGEAAEAVR